MSGATIGGVIGGVIGFWVGGPQGAQIGWMIGSAVGGYVDPEKIQGPRLTDATQQTSRDGVPITWGYGDFPTAGNIIWIQPGPPTEHKTKKRQGKGGPEVTTFTYTRSFAVGMCRGILREDGLFDPIGGVLIVKEYGKIVYDARPDDELIALGMSLSDIPASRAASAAFLANTTFYLGGEAQLPDPTIESWEGVNNVPAHRGLTYMVRTNHDVTRTEGAIQQYEFVVSVGGTAEEACGTEAGLRAWWPLNNAAEDGTAFELIGGKDATYYGDVSIDPPMNVSSTGSMLLDQSGEGAARNGDFGELNVERPPGFTLTCWFRCDGDTGDNQVIAASFYEALSGRIAWGFVLFDMQLFGGQGGGGFDLSGVTGPEISIGTTYFAAIVCENDGVWHLYLNGSLVGTNDEELGVGGVATYTQFGGNPSGAGAFLGAVSDVKLYDGPLTAAQIAANYTAAGSADLYPIPDAPGYYVRADGTVVHLCSDVVSRTPIVLATVVADLLRRAGLSSDQYDVSQLTDVLHGYRIASEGGIDSFLAPLMQGFFFDVAEWDGKVRAIKRGGSSVMTLTMDDLADKEGDALSWEMIQEAELLRKVTVGYIDPMASFNAVTQEFERRAGTIQALGESTIGLPVVVDATPAKQIAEKRVNVGWAENAKASFCLPRKFTALTPTDVITVVDYDNVSHRVRLMRSEEDSGLLMYEAPRDRQSAYTGSVAGTDPTLPTFPSANLIGPTLMMVMNLPVWRDEDDRLVLYVAVRGILANWSGANLSMSTDSGATFNLVDTITDPATIGYTSTDLEAWYSSEYPSIQTVTVWLPDAPESVSYETMLRYNNRAALQLDSGEWEILQYQTVVANGNNSYTLSGLLRGRYATTPGAAASGANFVLLDGFVHAIDVERWMIGQTLTLKAASLGTDPDANAEETYTYTTAVSQTEWPVTYVQAERDGSDNVTVTWIGRGRLGVETGPFHSQFFTGYRVTFDTGTSAGSQSFDTTEQTYTLASADDPITVTVAALNSITGAGPASPGITV